MAILPRLRLQPRAWLTRDFWRLETSKTSPASRDGWSNDDVDVVPMDKRTWRELDYLWLWLADGANVGTMFVPNFIFPIYLPSLYFRSKYRKTLN